MDVRTALSDLERQEFFVWDDFLSKEEVSAILADFNELRDHDQFKLAGTGRNQTVSPAAAGVRSDETCWLEPLQLNETQSIFWNRLEELKSAINENAFLGLWNLNGHYSYYPKEGYYHRHLDRFDGNDERTISMVLYLNPNWVKKDGGELRLHFPKQAVTTIDVDPIAGRLVCFLSATVLHEVMISHEIRKSFAGWWKRRPAHT